MTTVNEVYRYLNEKTPFTYQESWDNSGLNIGDPEGTVERVLVVLDITDEVIEEAIAHQVQLIVSHHPVIFHPVKQVTLKADDLTGRKIWRLAQAGISAICCHTNLDAVEEGVNTALARAIGLSDVCQLAQCGIDEEGRPYGFGRVGNLSREMPLEAFLSVVERALPPNSLRYVDGGKPVFKVAVGGGACGSFMPDALKAGCDTFITSDLKYNQFLDARELGINLIDAGHFPTENVVLPTLVEWLVKGFPDLQIIPSLVHKEVFRCYTSRNS